ncbi:putative hemolysin domain protein [Bordetella bronchiseptica]|nr:putative hemolysin domain protein [Bordetella bronchiseptica]
MSVKVPPLSPAMAAPTLAGWPLTAETCRSSLSGSVSFLSTPWAGSVTVKVVSSSVAPASATAVGAGLVTSHSKVWLTLLPPESVAVMVTV